MSLSTLRSTHGAWGLQSGLHTTSTPDDGKRGSIKHLYRIPLTATFVSTYFNLLYTLEIE